MMKVVIFDFYGVVFNPATRLPSEGLRDFLRVLHQRQISCGIASSSESEQIARFLYDNQLSEYFSVIIGLQQVTNTKPDPECYLQVAEFFQASPLESVIIDDSEAPLLQAQALGFKTIYFAQGLDNFSKIATLLGL